MFITMRASTQEGSATWVASERDRAATMGSAVSPGRRRILLCGQRADLRWGGGPLLENGRGERDRRPARVVRPDPPCLQAEERLATSEQPLPLPLPMPPPPDRRRRYEQLRHAEERLRPLQKTKLAEVYWRVHAEFSRICREIAEESGGARGGTWLDRE